MRFFGRMSVVGFRRRLAHVFFDTTLQFSDTFECKLQFCGHKPIGRVGRVVLAECFVGGIAGCFEVARERIAHQIAALAFLLIRLQRREGRRMRCMSARHCRASRVDRHSVGRRDRGRCNERSSFDRRAGSASARQEVLRRVWRRRPAPFEGNCPLSFSGSLPNAASRHNPRGRREARPAIPRAACAGCRGTVVLRCNAARSRSFRRRRRHHRSDS